MSNEKEIRTKSACVTAGMSTTGMEHAEKGRHGRDRCMLPATPAPLPRQAVVAGVQVKVVVQCWRGSLNLCL